MRDLLRIGLGASGIGNLYRAISEEQAQSTIAAALANGIQCIDTAPHYGFGLSEKREGTGLRRLDPSQQIIISTKVGRRLAAARDVDLGSQRQGFVSPEPFESVFDYSYDAILRSFEESCSRLGRRIDVLYVHDLGQRTHGDRHAEFFRQFIEDGYRAMRELRDSGAVAAIGLGVNECEVCEEALGEVEFDQILLAGRYTLLEQSALDSFFPLCEKLGVDVVIGGPYNSGILARGVRAEVAPTYDYAAAPNHVIRRALAIEEICDRHGVPLAAAALQFPLAHPRVRTVLPGMSSSLEVEQAAAWITHPIPGELWTELRECGWIRRDAPLPVNS